MGKLKYLKRQSERAMTQGVPRAAAALPGGRTTPLVVSRGQPGALADRAKVQRKGFNTFCESAGFNSGHGLRV